MKKSLLISVLLFCIVMFLQNKSSAQEMGGITGERTGEIVVSITGSDTGNICPASGNDAQVFFSSGTTGGNDGINTSGGDVTGMILPADIEITEVYFDGTDEWIELYNKGGLFSGIITLTGPSFSFSFPLIIKQNEIKILAKPSGDYLWILDKSVFIYVPTFGLTDTKAIMLTLSRVSQEQQDDTQQQVSYKTDTFFVDTGTVLKWDNKKTSLQKQNDSITGTSLENSRGVLLGYRANPGSLDSEFDVHEDTNIDISGQLVGSGRQVFVSTTGQESGQQTGQSVKTPIGIDELHYDDGKISPFLELVVLEDFSGGVFFSGTLLEKNFFQELSGENHEIIIVSKTDNGLLSDQRKVKNTSLGLRSSGNLMIYGQSGQVFDSIVVEAYGGKNSLYHTGFDDIWPRLFQKEDRTSPGFLEKYLIYLGGNISSAEAISSGSITTNTLPALPLVSEKQTLLSNSPLPGSVKIQAVSSTTPESITLSSSFYQYIDAEDKNRYLLSKSDPNISYPTRKRYLHQSLSLYETKTIQASFGFPNDDGCVGLFRQTFLIDEYCYQTISEKERENEQNMVDLLSGENRTDVLKKILIKTGTKTPIKNTKNTKNKTGIIPQVLDLLPKVNLTLLKDKVCTSYRGEMGKCKILDVAKKYQKQVEETKLLSAYLSIVQTYLKQDRKELYTQTKLSLYDPLFSALRKAQKKGKTHISKKADLEVYLRLKTQEQSIDSQVITLIEQSIDALFFTATPDKGHELGIDLDHDQGDQENNLPISKDTTDIKTSETNSSYLE